MVMRYTNNMEPKPPQIRDVMPSELAAALHNQDARATAEYLDHLATEDSPVANWAEALGTRLQIHDFLLQQKGSLATLHANQTPNVEQSIRNYLQDMDKNLAGILGHHPHKDETKPKESLKFSRIHRLTQETGPRMLDLVDRFSHQETHQVLDANTLIARTIDIRNGVVERLWSAAQTYSEGNSNVARQELDIEATAVNSEFDQLRGGILQVEEAS